MLCIFIVSAKSKHKLFLIYILKIIYTTMMSNYIIVILHNGNCFAINFVMCDLEEVCKIGKKHGIKNKQTGILG